MQETPKPIRLSAETVKAFDSYIHDAEAGMEKTLSGGAFLWCEGLPKRAEQVQKGEIPAEFFSGSGPLRIARGLIHDWIGAAMIPGATVERMLAVIQDYNNHKNIYKPEVMDSRLLTRRDNDFQIFLRLLKKKIITVVLDTDHDVHYSPVDRTRWCCQSYTTRISEVEDAGTPKEKVLEPDTGYGFLWRLYSYWRFQQSEKGVLFECRAISLTRDIPTGLGWVVEPIIRKLPKESLINTLKATREALTVKVTMPEKRGKPL